MSTSRTCLPASVPGSRLPATSSPETGGDRSSAETEDRDPETGGHRIPAELGYRQTGDRPPVRPPVRPPDPGHRRPPASGGKPNPAIPLGLPRLGLPHVRPRSRFRRTLVSGIASFRRTLVSGVPRSPWILGALENVGVWLVFGACVVCFVGASWGEYWRSVGTKHGVIWGLFGLEKPSKTRGYGTGKRVIVFCYVSHSTGSHQGGWFG